MHQLLGEEVLVARADSQIQRTEDSEAAGLVRLTGLWRGESKAGEVYLAGSVSASSRLLVLPNSHKQKPSDPDYIAYLAPQERKERPQARPGGRL